MYGHRRSFGGARHHSFGRRRGRSFGAHGRRRGMHHAMRGHTIRKYGVSRGGIRL